MEALPDNKIGTWYAGCISTLGDEIVIITGANGTEDNRVIVNPISSQIRGQSDTYTCGIEELSHEFPQLGMINAGISSLYVSRVNHVHHAGDMIQYKRLLHWRNTRVHDPHSQERRMMGLRRVEGIISSIGIVKGIFSQEFFTAEDAIRCLERKEKLSVAISPDYSFTLCRPLNCIALAKKTHIIGAFRGGVIKLAEEVRDLLEEVGETTNMPIELTPSQEI